MLDIVQKRPLEGGHGGLEGRVFVNLFPNGMHAGNYSPSLGTAQARVSRHDAHRSTLCGRRPGRICIARVVVALWPPGRALPGARLLAVFDAGQLRRQTAVERVPCQPSPMPPARPPIHALTATARAARL